MVKVAWCTAFMDDGHAKRQRTEPAAGSSTEPQFAQATAKSEELRLRRTKEWCSRQRQEGRRLSFDSWQGMENFLERKVGAGYVMPFLIYPLVQGKMGKS